MVVVDACMGIQPMTEQHVIMAVALKIPFFIVLTHIDRVSQSTVSQVITSIQVFLERVKLFDTPPRIACFKDETKYRFMNDEKRCEIPLFPVSNLSGEGLRVLESYLGYLTPTKIWPMDEDTRPELHIRNMYSTSDSSRIVVGFVQRGSLHVNELMLLGPSDNGAFLAVRIQSLQVDHQAVQQVHAGEIASALLAICDNEQTSFPTIKLTAKLPLFRKGMMLIHPEIRPVATLEFDAEIHLIHHDAMYLRQRYQAVIHAGPIQQMARLEAFITFEGRTMTNEGEQGSQSDPRGYSICRFRFLYRPEVIRPDMPLIVRDKCVHAVGKVLRAV
uniref:Elongation factor Tu, chloroplastic n=1 Tax=Albugo laibachii Nc14 TaxID=890382 RepID=F0X062_9STRA|nr:GTPbinding protein putative [Albugo laibachii Nc14]|eukprot:CCA27144.1 GTPbinding protein putative [Albugo laibachii Nc14]